MVYKKGSYLKVRSGEVVWAAPVDLIYTVDMNYFGTRILADSLWSRGVLYYHGDVVPAFDFQGLIENKETESKGDLICIFEGSLIAFVVSEFEFVFQVSREEYFAARDKAEETDDFIRVNRDQESVILINEDTIKRAFR